MTTLTCLMLVAALLPALTALIAKAGGRAFDNNEPRVWLAGQQGWRARANAAQANTFEALPFFFAALLLALHNGADTSYLVGLAGAWLVLRVAYVGLYLAGLGTLRSLVWAAAVAVNIAMLFASA
ncbi:MAPEG family protein [Bordetella sp. BOR01]|uniref:MAPEG family protein n=1 Tax=Bordetella sp. BOR01 TaxID=2854779 RepID=UPI001C456131|nr:MAPEG family protein [Bordetella sp. BOR01]MBV7485871.1 MAPEG family protein [Bordetella sp. BOR01]